MRLSYMQLTVAKKTFLTNKKFHFLVSCGSYIMRQYAQRTARARVVGQGYDSLIVSDWQVISVKF